MEGTSDKSGGRFFDDKVDVRLKISALWAATLFIFAYVDLFGFFRVDIINGVMAGKVSAFQIDQTFLLLTTIYVVIPSLMVALSLLLKASINRWANIVVGVLYAASILASCIGEVWLYYIVGSIIETLLLAVVVWLAWTWRPQDA